MEEGNITVCAICEQRKPLETMEIGIQTGEVIGMAYICEECRKQALDLQFVVSSVPYDELFRES